MTRVIAVDAASPERDAIAEAAAVLRRGGLVAFPTETVYGLGADALNVSAVEKVFAAKGRPATDPVIVHLADVSQIARVAREVPSIVTQLARSFWPGALTLIVEKMPQVPDAVTAGLTTVAVRVPAHPVAHALIRAAGVPVAAPSANRFSRPSPTRAEHVLADLGGAVDVVLDAGATTIGVESTILDLTVSPPVVRRHGGVTVEQISTIVPDVRVQPAVMSADAPQPSPGQLMRHYAPRAQMTLYLGDTGPITMRVAEDIRAAVASGLRVGVLAPEEDLRALAPRLAPVGATGRVVTAPCGSRADREQAARDLFRVLREIDAAEVDVIYALAPRGNGLDAAIVDRLTRASEGRVVHVRA
jgi:L-threonylcarbamoyladenylate synthase